MTLDYSGELDPNKPYESMARRLIDNVQNGPSIRRIRAAIGQRQSAERRRRHPLLSLGLQATMGMALLARRMLSDAGLPTLVLDGDGCDSRNVADGQMGVTQHQRIP